MDDNSARIKRVDTVIKWLIYNDVVESKTDLCAKINRNTAYLSQILKGTVPVSDKFLVTLVALEPKLNLDWLRTGQGSMSTENDGQNNSANEALPNGNSNCIDIIKNLTESLAIRDRQIDKLIDLLSEDLRKKAIISNEK